MFSVSVNGAEPIKTEIKLNGNTFEGSLGGKNVKGSIIKVSDFEFHLLYSDRSFNISVIKSIPEEKSLVIKVNGSKMHLQLKDKYDELLHSLGMDNLNAKKMSDVKAPMPGMVLNVLVHEGISVKKGDALIVLEAMKMENILKSPGDGTIKKIIATKGKAVEKNEVLIQF